MSEIGWRPDPAGAPRAYRYWNGTAWSKTTTEYPYSALIPTDFEPEAVPDTSEPSQSALEAASSVTTSSNVTTDSWQQVTASQAHSVAQPSSADQPWSAPPSQPKTQPSLVKKHSATATERPTSVARQPQDRPKSIPGLVIVVIIGALLGAAAWAYSWTDRLIQSALWTQPDPQPTVAEGTKGALYVWGSLPFGLDGTAAPSYYSDNFAVARLSNVVAVATSFAHALAVDADGQAWSWGSDTYDKLLGVGSNDDLTVRYPIPIPTLTDVSDVAMGPSAAYALKTDGTVWAWGSNYSCQLGDGSQTDNPYPTQVSGLSEITQIAAGNDFALALRADGTLWVWGISVVVGDVVQGDLCTPAELGSLANVTSIAAGTTSVYAVRGDGTVMVWGYTNTGSLGIGIDTVAFVPTPVLISDVVSVSVGSDFALALKGDGTVWAWGNNAYGTLGDGTTDDAPVPLQVVGLSEIKAVAAGDRTAYALDADGNVWAWGDNREVQYGDPALPNSRTPIQLTRLHNIVSITASPDLQSFHAMAIQG